MEKIKIKKVNLTGTLRNMPENSEVEFKTSDFDIQSIRAIASRLKKVGRFSVRKKASKAIVSRSPLLDAE